MTVPTRRPEIAESVLDLIGRTPLVRIAKLGPANGATVRFPNALLRDATLASDGDGDNSPDRRARWRNREGAPGSAGSMAGRPAPPTPHPATGSTTAGACR